MLVYEFDRRIVIDNFNMVVRILGLDIDIAIADNDIQIHRTVAVVIEIHLIVASVNTLVVCNILQINLALDAVIQFVFVVVDLIGNHFPIPYADDSGRIEIGQLLFVGNQNDQLFLGNGLDDIHDLERVFAVEVSSWFVCDDDLRILDNGTRNADSLTLAAREHVSVTVTVPVHADFLENVIDFLFDFFLVLDANHAQRDGDIVKDGHIVNQIVVLENISDVQRTDLINLAFAPPGDFLTVNENASAVDFIQSANGVQQGRLAAA